MAVRNTNKEDNTGRVRKAEGGMAYRKNEHTNSTVQRRQFESRRIVPLKSTLSAFYLLCPFSFRFYTRQKSDLSSSIVLLNNRSYVIVFLQECSVVSVIL